MRIGIFGGTFDPPHVGHLLAATDALDLLALDRVVWVPVAQQPLKTGQPVTPGSDRLAMVRAAIGGVSRFSADALELERGGLSYTVDTLRAFHARGQDGPLALFLLLGADAAATLPKWREPEAIAQLSEIVVLTRDTAEPAHAWPAAWRVLATRKVEVSSTEVRARVATGRSIRGFVPDAVAEYIAAAGLYR